jgi:hypothetical protein
MHGLQFEKQFLMFVVTLDFNICMFLNSTHSSLFGLYVMFCYHGCCEDVWRLHIMWYQFWVFCYAQKAAPALISLVTILSYNFIFSILFQSCFIFIHLLPSYLHKTIYCSLTLHSIVKQYNCTLHDRTAIYVIKYNSLYWIGMDLYWFLDFINVLFVIVISVLYHRRKTEEGSWL